ncbi:Crp/Fnr family transcriptional regulator [Actinophytocola sp.]|uniref:Crp/Fnr family transcriptional regulator n=1 Tax=Actinophytocola sp. TaxID=1872138 RepID=UPI002D7FA2A8|nr:Crp/Fnr family transcriptional regulator [Actinophytocola sp.]HET9141238.1 Crp/Fnr family transcriptional regulator [Actinophytocola sp.]
MPPNAEPLDPVGILGGTTLFAALGDSELESVAARCLRRTYGKGQYLCYQGDPGDRLFIVGRGLVKVVLVSDQGGEMVLITLGTHEMFGELAVLDQGPRSASVVAVVPTTVLMLTRPVLLELMGTHAAVRDALLTSLGALVRRLTEQAGDLVFLDLGARLAKLLLRLAEDSGQTGDRIVVELGLTQSDLAGMIGASRPAVNRVLQTLVARGLVEISGHSIVLRDLLGLRRRAGV